MPRINVTDEELRALEQLRRKNERTLGFNEALEQVSLLIETGAINTHGDHTDAELTKRIRDLKRTLPL